MDLPVLLLALGALLIVGLATDEIGRRTRLPRVTLLILFGLAAGPAGLDLLPTQLQDWYAFLASVALTMVAFLLGGRLSLEALQSHGKAILVVSLVVVVLTAMLVGVGLIAIGVQLVLALLLAGIANCDSASRNPGRRQTGTREGAPSQRRYLGIVAVDDAWGLIVFSLLLIAARAITGESGLVVLQHGLWDLGGALLVGAVVGFPAAFLTGRLQPG